MSVKVTPPSTDFCQCTDGAGLPDAAAVNDTELPAVTGTLLGCVVIDGAVCTVKVPTFEVAAPAGLVNTARTRDPSSPAVTVNESDVLVAPGIAANVAPPSVDFCHCTDGAGLPDAVAVNDTELPAVTAAFSGCVMIDGAVCTVNVPAFEVAAPTELVNTARYEAPLSPAWAVNVSGELVAPGMSVNVVPPSTDLCHCTDGAGLPDAPAVNDTDAPAVTVALSGCVVTAGAARTVKVTGFEYGGPPSRLTTCAL
jgi:hypothetical protein